MKPSFTYKHMNARFISRYKGVSTYGVYDRNTHTEHRIDVQEDGSFTACARDATPDEIAAVQAFLANEKKEYEIWREANKHLYGELFV